MTGRQFILFLILLLAFTVQAGAASYPIIVQISPTANITTIVSALQATVVDVIPDSNIYLLNAPSLLTEPNPLLGIEWAEPNLGVTLPGFVRLGVLKAKDSAPADWYRYQPAMMLIRAGEARDYSTGRGIVVADINSQVDYSHPALIGHLTTGYDFVSTKSSEQTALNQSSAGYLDQSSAGYLDSSTESFLNQSSAGYLDQSSAGYLDGTNPAYSHATLTAGVIAVIASDCMIMELRAFDDNGSADTFTIAKAIRYAVKQGAQIINMSFGTLSPSQALKSAVEFAQKNNVLLAASAGNNNNSEPQYPAAYKDVMTTAATDLLDKKASFSNYGKSMFAAAPGVNIISAHPGGYYSVVSGTSFSAPAVSGTAALVLSLRRTGVAGSISGGAVNIDSSNPNYAGQLGYGRIDVLRAVKPN